MRVLLIQPSPAGQVGLQKLMLLEPLGLERLAAMLPQDEVVILDLRVDRDLPAAVASLRPQLVGISCGFATEVATTMALARQVKQLAPEATVLVGGHHPSLRPQDFAGPYVDAIAQGEGEATLAETVRCLETGGDLAGVAGLVINGPGGQQRTPARPAIANLDDLPPPARHLTRRFRHRYYWTGQGPHALVETARGCPHQCKFCGVWRFHEGVRTMSPEAIVREIAGLQEPWIIFADDNFLSSVARARRTAELLAQQGIRKRYIIQTRSDTVVQHPELIAQWHQIGLVLATLGLESISDRVLDDWAKRNSVENNSAALRILREVGLDFAVNFIADPQWDRADFEALRQYLRQHRLFTASFTILTPLPGTALFDEMQGSVTTRDWERYDLWHAVLPTKLPLEEFYAEYASLWRTTAQLVPARWRATMFLRGLGAAMKGQLDFGHVRRLEREVRAMGDPQTYLRGHHELAASSASHSPATGPACAPGDP
jgi:radical SAM superfamily enzyme YgiQ (UPF0313 family)